MEVQAIIRENGQSTHDHEALRGAKEARFWILSDDREYPLSYLKLLRTIGHGRGPWAEMGAALFCGPRWGCERREFAGMRGISAGADQDEAKPVGTGKDSRGRCI